MSNKRLRLTIDQKIELLDCNATGRYSQIELGEWAKSKFNLDKPLIQQTISTIIQSAEKIYSNVVVKKNGKSMKLPSYPQLDNEVSKYVTEQNSHNQPVDRRSILVYIRHIASVKYKIPEGEINFSDGWLTKVMKRLGLKSRPTHGECASVDITSDNLQAKIKKIQKILEEYSPEDIMNFDETGLYYEQPPKRTICREPLGGLKKSKKRLTVGLLCNSVGTYKGHPIVIGQYKKPKCFTTKAKLLAKTAVGNSHEVEYHDSPNAWMTSAIFTRYIVKLDRAFKRQNRHVALLLDNATVHKVNVALTNTKLVFLPANTTSKLQPLDAGIIANFKAHFRAHQYDRALSLFLTNKLDNRNVYAMDQVQAMYYIAASWLKVTPDTLKNCWRHTNILGFMDKNHAIESSDVQFPNKPLDLEQAVVEGLNSIISELPGNNDEVYHVSELDLETDESSMILTEPTGTDGIAQDEEEDEEEAEETEGVEIDLCKKRLREAYETILEYEIPLDDLDRQFHRRVRMRLADSRAEYIRSKNQTDLRSYFN